MYISSFPTKYPHKSLNPTPSPSHTYSTRALIAILLQFRYIVSLPPVTGKRPERIICSTRIFLLFPTNTLHFCTILVVPSMSSLLVLICTRRDPPWSCPNMFYILSVTCSILAPGRKTTISSPLICVLLFFLLNAGVHKYTFCSQCHSITAPEWFFVSIYLAVDFQASLPSLFFISFLIHFLLTPFLL